MRLLDVERQVQDFEGFADPNVALEQYATPPWLAARMAHIAQHTYYDIENKVVCDLGVGCGILSGACFAVGATAVVGVDIDPQALRIAQKNNKDSLSDLTLVNANVINDLSFLRLAKFDVCVMNPPFGTRCQGADTAFLKQGLSLADTVYSMHKSSTRPYILQCAEKWKCNIEVLAQVTYDIQRSYDFHKKQKKDIKVDLIRVTKQQQP